MKRTNAMKLGLLSFAITCFTGCGAAGYAVADATGVKSYDVTNSSFRAPVELSTQEASRRSWIKPDAATGPLVYISSAMTREIDIYSLSQGRREGVLAGLDQPQGLCSDSKGNVFTPQQDDGTIVEYAHAGTSPIATLSDPGQQPISCSVDPSSGTLAVANVLTYYEYPGSISLYSHASGFPTIVSDPEIQLVYECGYDNRGDLFIDGYTTFPSGGGVFQFAELPKGKTSFTNISLNKEISIPGAVQWDGTFVAVGDARTGIIYRINGSSGKVESTVKLAGATYDFQPWIYGKSIVVPAFYSIHTGLWKYPAGGEAQKRRFKAGSPFGVTVSVAAK